MKSIINFQKLAADLPPYYDKEDLARLERERVQKKNERLHKRLMPEFYAPKEEPKMKPFHTRMLEKNTPVSEPGAPTPKMYYSRPEKTPFRAYSDPLVQQVLDEFISGKLIPKKEINKEKSVPWSMRPDIHKELQNRYNALGGQILHIPWEDMVQRFIDDPAYPDLTKNWGVFRHPKTLNEKRDRLSVKELLKSDDLLELPEGTAQNLKFKFRDVPTAWDDLQLDKDNWLKNTPLGLKKKDKNKAIRRERKRRQQDALKHLEVPEGDEPQEISAMKSYINITKIAKKSQDWINEKTKYLIEKEGKDPDQAYAIANSMAKKDASTDKKWIQKAVPESHEGKFHDWAVAHGFKEGVSQSAIDAAIQAGGHAAQMANFAINVSKGKYHHPNAKKDASFINLTKIAELDAEKDARVIPAAPVPNSQEYTIKVTTGKNEKDIMNFDGVGISYFKVVTNQESLNKVVEDYLKSMKFKFPMLSWGVISSRPAPKNPAVVSAKQKPEQNNDQDEEQDEDFDPEREEFEAAQRHREDYTHPDNA